MNCEQCYHYQACLSVDVTGFVADPNKNCEEPCEHFLNPEDVQPTAHWERQVCHQKYHSNVVVDYRCSRCGARNETVYSHDIIDKELWYGYMHQHWMPKNPMHSYCPGCGAKMDLEKTDHRNHAVDD